MHFFQEARCEGSKERKEVEVLEKTEIEVLGNNETTKIDVSTNVIVMNGKL